VRTSRLLVLLLLSALLGGLAIPAAATEAEHTRLPVVERTRFHGLYFPAGMAGTGTECPYLWVDPAFCIVEQGSWTQLPKGETLIRDMLVYELAFSWNDEGVEPRKTGYDMVTANANLDQSLTGPTWGTWKLYNFDSELMFTGRFVGRFKDGIPAVYFSGRGTAIYEGQRMSGFVGREPDANGWNMYGRIVNPWPHH